MRVIVWNNIDPDAFRENLYITNMDIYQFVQYCISSHLGVQYRTISEESIRRWQQSYIRRGGSVPQS